MTEIPELQELEFEESGHIYKLFGMEVPSVTTLMKPLSSKVYGPIDTDVLDRAARRGTAIHNAIENYLDFGIEDIDEQYEGYFEAFKKWFGEKKPVVLATECRVYHKILRYAGTCDLLCLIDGELILVDYKSSSAVNSMLCGVQLEGYDRAWESHGLKIKGRRILHLKKNGTYAELNYERSSKCWAVLSALITIDSYTKEF